jgi:hypothetical protein
MSAVVALQRGLTPAKALASAQVGVLHRADPGGLAEALGNLLTFTALQFNVVRNLSDLQIQLLATDLPSRYYHWRIQEFVYVMREAVAGKWGKVYDRLDPPTVYDWCSAYAAEEQAQAVADAAEKRAAAYKALQPHIDPMPVLYLRQQVEERYRPDQWLNLQRWLHKEYPGRDDLQQVVSDVDAEYTRQRRIEATREKLQREKARKMLEAAAGFAKTPGEKEFAAGLITVLPSLPKMKHLNESEWEAMQDAHHTSAEEAA